MDKIILILGDRTDEISRTLKTHYSESVELINSFEKPSDFAEYYSKTPLRVNRIIVSESSFYHDRYTEITEFKKCLENFYVVFDQCFFLVSNNEETNTLLKFLVEDETFIEASKLKIFSHERYTPKITIDYCLNKISRKFYEKTTPEYEELVRRRRDSQSTFRLEDEEEKEPDIVVLDNENIQIRHLQQKLKNLNSLSNLVKGETWEDNKIIKDIYKIEKLMTVSRDEKRYDIDYSDFYLSKNVKSFNDNIIIVTGEKRSGKTTMAYCLAKSASNYKKVLVVDFDVKGLGLSHLAETVRDVSTVMLLQSFKNDFKNSIRTLVKSSSKLNFILSNTKTLKELGDIDPLNFLSLIVNTCSKYYDKVIFDIPVTDINYIIPVMKKSDKVILTVPTNLNNIVSTVSTLNELGLTKDLIDRNLVIVPVDIYNKISGIKTLTKPQIKDILTKIFSDNIAVMPEIQITSFKLDQSLFKAVESIITEEA